MDSYFKAAVCDLDKLLDDFELNPEEAEGSSTTTASSACQDPAPYPHRGINLQCFTPETSSVSHTLPDLNALHYGPTAPSSSLSQRDQDTKGSSLAGVDLLSSVDSRAAKGSTPPCPDRSLKPVCDLVNDTGPANLPRKNSHDALGHLEVADNQVVEGLLVDFDSPVVQVPVLQKAGSVDRFDGPSNSLSLLDVILPAAVERTGEPQDTLKPLDSNNAKTPQCSSPEASDSPELPNNVQSAAEGPVFSSIPVCASGTEDTTVSSDVVTSLTNSEDVQQIETNNARNEEAPSVAQPKEKESALSCLPVAVSMCGSLVASLDSQEDTTSCETKDQTEVSSPECEEVSPAEADESMAGSPTSADIGASVSFSRPDSSPEDEPELVEIMTNPKTAAEVPDPLPDRNFESSFPETLECRDFPESNQSPSYTESPSNPAEFAFSCDYLPESEQNIMMVTDEELDAYLMGQVAGSSSEMAAERVAGDGFSEFNGDLDGDELLEAELRSGRVDTFASPESDRSLSFLEESEGSNISSSSQESSPSKPDGEADSPNANRPPCYGGARPKQLPTQTARPLTPQDEQNGSQSEENLAISGEKNRAPSSPPTSATRPTPSHGESNSESPAYEQYDDTYGHDELSEPPPYPGVEGESVSSPCRSGTVEDGGLGSRQPPWVPDSEAPNCMKCEQKFTFTKRRHHCRACGKVYCAICCNRKCRLKYLDKEARVCVLCYETIQKAQALERMMSPTGPSPNPNVPSEYCSTIPPMQQAQAAGTLNSPPPTVMVPVSVLKHPGHDGFPREQKHVWFADGILPNGEVADTTRLSVRPRRSSQESSPVTPDPPLTGNKLLEDGMGVSEEGVEPAARVARGPWDYALLCGVGGSVPPSPSLLPDEQDALPPLLITTEDQDAGDVLVEERPAACQIMLLLAEGGPRPLTFVLNANLVVNVKLVTYGGRKCWCFSSNGLQGVGQREVAFIIESLSEESSVPRDIFTLYINIYQDAQKGKVLEELGSLSFTDSFLGSKEHGGFLFFSPSFQPLEGLDLPHSAFLCGVLLHKLEVPWAKVFPLRLLLGLGARHNVYPSPLVSVRFRESVFRETGHTIMNLLADLRNYQYTVPVVEGLHIHMEMGNSYIDIPKNKFNEMLKVVNSSNEHVISVGACFSPEADSHLVCVQNEDSSYQTQANSVQGRSRRVTGASFVVFNGALKASSGFIAKSSIVEDGLMVQIPPDTMEALRQALREQTDFHITCGKTDSTEARENVSVRWTDWTAAVNTGVKSPVDGRSLEGVPSVRLQQDGEFEMDGRSIRCTEVFYLLKSPESSLSSVLSSCAQFQREMCTAGCAALCPHLAVLTHCGINFLALRLSTHADMVEYQAGSGGCLLPQKYLNELDGALIPVIHGGSSCVPHLPMDIEFFFYITHCT